MPLWWPSKQMAQFTNLADFMANFRVRLLCTADKLSRFRA